MANINLINNYLLINKISDKIDNLNKYSFDSFLVDKYKHKNNILLGIVITLSIIFLLLVYKYVIKHENTSLNTIVNKYKQTGGFYHYYLLYYYGHDSIADFFFQPLFYFKICLYAYIIFVIIGWLGLRKISLRCIGCSKGSWWYKCLPNTGDGSMQCTIEKTNISIINQFITLITTLKSKLSQIYNMVKTILTTLRTLITSIPQKIVNLINKYTTIPSFSIPSIDISCSVTIPIINVNINPCTPIDTMINGLITALNGAASFLTLLINTITSFLKTLLMLILDMFKLLLNELSGVLNSFISPFSNLANIVSSIKNLINDILEIINLKGIINMILYYIVNTIRDSTGLNIGTIFVLTSFICLLFWIAPLISGILYGYYATFLMTGLL